MPRVVIPTVLGRPTSNNPVNEEEKEGKEEKNKALEAIFWLYDKELKYNAHYNISIRFDSVVFDLVVVATSEDADEPPFLSTRSLLT